MNVPDFKSLKISHKKISEQASEEFNIRVHRALKWLERSEKENGDQDAEFIFLWISFNAAYAQLFGTEQTEKKNFKAFLELILKSDSQRKIHRILFENFSGSIRTLIENKFVYEGFWQALRDHDSSGQWEKQFERGKKKAMSALLEQDIMTVLSIVFDRLYVLRNQLVHGGATWNSQVNRQQVMDGGKLLRQMVPIILEVMIDNSQEDFGELIYPVV